MIPENKREKIPSPGGGYLPTCDYCGKVMNSCYISSGNLQYHSGCKPSPTPLNGKRIARNFIAVGAVLIALYMLFAILMLTLS